MKLAVAAVLLSLVLVVHCQEFPPDPSEADRLCFMQEFIANIANHDCTGVDFFTIEAGDVRNFFKGYEIKCYEIIAGKFPVPQKRNVWHF